jgi:N-acetylglucosaminyl-diphospho-decaprenol L-rhamnosyltransferase
MRPGPVSAVVVNYNAAGHLADCVRSLRADGADEIVVVDNASTDASHRAVTEADASARWIETGRNLGFGRAANRGVVAATHDLVAIMNPDAVVEPGALKALVDVLDAEPAIAAVGPRVDNPDGSWYPSARAFPSLTDALGHAFLHYVSPDNRFSRRYKLLDWDHDTARDVDWISGTFMLVRREAFESVGGFDEAFFMYVEDVDLCWRLRAKGWRVRYEPAARVVHAIGGSSEGAPYRMIVAHHRSLFRFVANTYRGPKRMLLPVIGAGLAVRAVLACAQRAMRRKPPAAP